jgi:hypothetical protein
MNNTIFKEDILNKLRGEVKLCKRDHQHSLWTFWHYASQQMQFADTNAQFRLIKDTWKSIGFEFSEKRSYPETAKAIGARSVTAHVWKNRNRTEHNSESCLEPLSIMLGYYAAGNEVITWEINM